MTETYNPLKDPTADGFTFVGVAVDPAIEQALAPSKEDWKEPLWAKFKNWVIGFSKAVCVVALGVAVGYGILAFGKDYLAHQKTIEAIQNPPSGSPEIGASPSVKAVPKRQKSATENIATKAINTPAKPSFEGVKTPAKKPVIDDSFTSQFDQDLSKFEAIIKKEFP